MKIQLNDLEEAYGAHKPANVDEVPCKAPQCFVNSYAPVSKPGEIGTFHNNTYFLQPNRKFELAGAVSVRSKDFKCT
jgi:hypothetical protein